MVGMIRGEKHGIIWRHDASARGYASMWCWWRWSHFSTCIKLRSGSTVVPLRGVDNGVNSWRGCCCKRSWWRFKLWIVVSLCHGQIESLLGFDNFSTISSKQYHKMVCGGGRHSSIRLKLASMRMTYGAGDWWTMNYVYMQPAHCTKTSVPCLMRPL